MENTPSRRDFGRKLQEQLNNIKDACERYDRRSFEAALGIAVALRIIFHDKGRQVSLISHLGTPNIRLLSTAPDPIGLTKAPTGLLTKLEIKPDALRQEFMPFLGDAAPRRWVPVKAWWEEDYVYKDVDDTITINRRDLALSVAEQDGGAHIDARLGALYQRIVDGAGWGMNVEPPNGSSIVVVPTNAHFAPLRQMGWELLHSPDLQRLARKGK